jgi:copper transport protein
VRRNGGPALVSSLVPSESDRRRSLRVAAIVLCLAIVLCPVVSAASLAADARVLLHATLLRSTPAANGRLEKSPTTIRLVFSEQIVAELSRITLVGTAGDSVSLKVANDPHDAHVLIGGVAGTLSGPYHVVWHVISADGHSVGGTFTFTVGSVATAVASGTSAAAPPPISAGSSAAAPQTSTTEDKPVPVMAALFRGVGLGGMLAGVGILFFGVSAGERRTLIPGAMVTILIAVGALLLVAHALMWLENITPTGRVTGDFLSSVLRSTVGRVELIRVVLAVLTLWAIALARHRTIALWLGVGCLIVSGAVGHPAAIHPYLAIPAKVVHLLAISSWLGGLLWLVWLARYDEAACRIEARRVSAIALIAVIAIFLSGLLQTVLFLNSPSDLFRDDYGRLVLAKMAGLAILVAFGAYNRFGLLPTSETAGTIQKLSRSVKQEIAIISIVILIGGFLAYVPTPPIPR